MDVWAENKSFINEHIIYNLHSKVISSLVNVPAWNYGLR